jgi:hypothetical protein
MIINIILYILLGVGVGYFIYLIYIKWSQLEKYPKPRFKLSSIKKLLDRIAVFKNNFLNVFKTSNLKKIRKINLKDFNKYISKLKNKILNIVTCILQFFKRIFKKIKQFLLSIKLPKKDKIKFEIKSLNNKKAKTSRVNLKKKVLSNFKKVFRQQKARTEKAQKNILAFFKKIFEKVSIKKILIFFKTFQKKIKLHFISQEDEKAKERFQASEIKQKTQKEAYLGDLLKKTLPEKKTEKLSEEKIKKPKEESIIHENVLEKEMLEQKSYRPKTLQEGLDKINQLKDQVASQKKEISSEQVSQATLNKIEQDLVKQILADPKNIEAYKKLGKLYYNQEQFDYAKETFEAALKLGSGDNKIKELLKECELKLEK